MHDQRSEATVAPVKCPSLPLGKIGKAPSTPDNAILSARAHVEAPYIFRSTLTNSGAAPGGHLCTADHLYCTQVAMTAQTWQEVSVVRTDCQPWS